MRIKAAIIQSFPDELFKSYWVDWCDTFLSNGLHIIEEDLLSFNIKSIPDMPQNSDPPTRALELFRAGVLQYPINVNSNKTQAWRFLANSKSIITNLGFIAYAITKTYFTEEHKNNIKLEKAFSAICALSVIQQKFIFKYNDEERVISPNTIYQKIISSFPEYYNDNLAKQYFACGMICSLKYESYNLEFIRNIISNNQVEEFIITNNGINGGNIRESINKSNLRNYLDKLLAHEISFNDTTNQRFSNFFVGNYSDNPTRGYINNSFKYYKDFLKECSKIEIENWQNNPMQDLYCNENYNISNPPLPDVFLTLKKIFSQFSTNKLLINDIMKSLKEGCLEAINILGWSDTTTIPTKNKNVIYYGAPGTGKSYKVEQLLSSVPEDRKVRVTFHPEYDNVSFVGGYKPISEFDEVNNKFIINYKFVPQIFTSIYIKAWLDKENDYYLIIEEINRGNCAEIFGEFFQLLDRNSKYTITPSIEMIEYLKEKLNIEHEGIKGGKMKLPSNLLLYATMNTSDQSLFPIDSAFKRRWNWEYIPINYEEINIDGSLNVAYNYKLIIDGDTTVKWIDFIKKINERIKANPNLGMDKCIGNYFIKPVENEIELDELVNKVIFYLWSDVFKDEDNDIFPNGVTYEDFFPVSTNGILQIKVLLKNLELID